ncbi:helix-turn-helix domain-containing protein [Dietzia sp. 179-F 9C3 NHS]|uniref:helix-turn-helix domain-containing protein n=1 Tax=Dietzia sp. 179-F 9C3 NHS TaxID=3374295 RepID=UPI003879B924
MRPNVGHMTSAYEVGRIPAIDLPVRLLVARQTAGLTQTELAKLIGSARQTVQNYEAGKSPRRATVMAWAMATGVNATWLLTGEAPPSDDDGASGVVRPKGLEPLTS